MVEVPENQAQESVSFLNRNGSSGYKVNAFTGATQETIDALLSIANPRTLVIAGNLVLKEIGSNLKVLVLGIHTPWPESLPQSGVEKFTSMTTQSTTLLPQQIRELSLFEFDATDLSSFQEFRQLTAIRLTEAKNLRSLDGLPMTLTHVDVVKCRKLKDITALRHSNVQHFSAQLCPQLTKSAIEDAQTFIQLRKNSV